MLYSLCFMGGVFLLKSFISCLLNLKKQREKLESMGEADILLIGAMGGILGFLQGFLALLVACIISLPFFLMSHKRRFELPFIPFLSLAFIAVFGIRGLW